MTQLILTCAALLGLLSWLMPNHYLPWLSFHAELVMAVAGLLALATCFRRDAPATRPLTPLLAASLLLVLLPPLQWLGGLHLFAGDAWMSSAYLLGFALALWLGQQLVAAWDAERAFEPVAGVLVAAAVLSIGVALYQWLSLHGLGIFAIDMPPDGRPFANLGQPNHLSTLLFLGLVGGLFLFERRRIHGPVTALLCAYLLFGLAMTTSRTAWLAMTLLVAGLWLARGRTELRLPRAAMAGLALFFVALVFAWPRLCDALLLSSGRDFANQATAGPRTILWSTALDAISRAPWFGYGWNQALVAQSRVLLENPSGGRLIGSTHNLLLDLLVWCGIPLGAAIFGGLLWWGWRRIVAARTPVAVYLLLALAGVFAHAMVELPLSFAYFLLTTGLLMGLLDTAGMHTLSLPTVRRGWFAGIGALATVLLGFIVIDYARVEDNVRTLRFESARIGTGKIESTAPELMLLTQWSAYLQAARVQPHAGMRADELAQMARVAERFPYAPLQLSLAVAQGLNSQPAEATLTMRRLCALHTPRRCREQLAEWQDLVQTTHPELAAIALPPTPPRSLR